MDSSFIYPATSFAAVAIAGGTFAHLNNKLNEFELELDKIRKSIERSYASAAAAENASARSAASFRSLSESAGVAGALVSSSSRKGNNTSDLVARIALLEARLDKMDENSIKMIC